MGYSFTHLLFLFFETTIDRVSGAKSKSNGSMYYCYGNGPTGVQSRRVKSLVCTLQTSTSRALLQLPRHLMHFLRCCRRRCRAAAATVGCHTLHGHLPRLSFAMIKRKNLTPKKMGSNVFQGHNSNCDNELLDIGESRQLGKYLSKLTS